MSVARDGGTIAIVGEARIEDAETLAALLAADSSLAVDLTRAGSLHTAVLQVLVAFRPRLVGPAGDPFVARWLVPAVEAGPPAEPPAV